MSDRNQSTSHNKLRKKYYLNKDGTQYSEKIKDSIDCFIYDYEKKQRYFISLKDKKQIRLLLNLIEMNLEGFLMEDLIVKKLQSSLLQELILLNPCTQRHLKISPYLKSITFGQREKKLRVDCPLSIMYHLLVDSKQIENYYHCINRNYTLPFKDLGKCLVSASMYYIKCSDSASFCSPGGIIEDEGSIGSSHKLLKIPGGSSDSNNKNSGKTNPAFKFSILLQFHVMPMNQRYKAYRFILSLADLREIDVLLFRHLQKQEFQESMLQRLVKLMSQQFIKVRTSIGSVLAVSPDRVQTIHSVSGKKLILRLSHFHSYQDSDSIVDGSLNYHRSGSANQRLRNAEIINDSLSFEKNESLSPEELETLARIENRKWRVFIKSLKYSKNKVLKHDFQMSDTVYRKRLMQDIIEQRRIILQRAQKFFDREYTIITVLRDILKCIFVIQLYIPKTCRTIQISFGDENLNEVNPQIINQWLTQKLLFFHQNTQIPPFTSFLFFAQRVQATNKYDLETIFKDEKDELTKKSIFRWQKINKDNQKKYEQQVPEYGVGTPKSMFKKSNLKSGLTRFGNSVQRLSDAKKVEFDNDFNFSTLTSTKKQNNERQFFQRSQSKNSCIVSPDSLESQESRMKRNLADLVRNNISAIKNKPSVIIEYFKPPEVLKAEKLKQFQGITHSLDQAFKKRQDNLKLSHMTRFIEIQIWTNILGDLYFLPNDLKKDIMIMIGDSSYQVQELLHHENLNVDGKQDIQIEISIDLIQLNIIYFDQQLQSISRPYLIKMRKQYQETSIPYQQMSPTYSLLRQQLLDFYFLPVEFIPYNSTGDFNLIINNFQINENKSQQISINLREIINVFIADGFYKSQSNYQNSRMSYSELKQLCYFVLYKIKKQNFLDLIEKKKIKKPKYQNSQIIKGLSLIDKSYIYDTPRQQNSDQPFFQPDSPLLGIEGEKKRATSFNANHPRLTSAKQSKSPSQQSSNRQITILNQSFTKTLEQGDSINQSSASNLDMNASSMLLTRSSRVLTVGTNQIIKPFQILFETQLYEKITLLDPKRRIFLKVIYYTMQNSFKFIVFRAGQPGRTEQIKTLDYFCRHLFSFKYYAQMQNYKEILRHVSLSRQQHLLRKFEDLLREKQKNND